MKSKHEKHRRTWQRGTPTPGPYSIEWGEDEECWITAPTLDPEWRDLELIARVHGGWAERLSFVLPNARLLAASWDLLYLLKRIVQARTVSDDIIAEANKLIAQIDRKRTPTRKGENR